MGVIFSPMVRREGPSAFWVFLTTWSTWLTVRFSMMSLLWFWSVCATGCFCGLLSQFCSCLWALLDRCV